MKRLSLFLLSLFFLVPSITHAEEPAVLNNGISITSSFAPAKNYYDLLETITFQVNLSTGGAGITGGANPRLIIGIAGNDYFANYNAGSGSSNLIFNLTVSADMNDANGITVKGFNLAQGGLSDSSSGDPLTILGADFVDIDINTHIDGRTPVFSSTTLTSTTGSVNGGIRYINNSDDVKVTINLGNNDTRGTSSATLKVGADTLTLNFTGSASTGTSDAYQKTTPNNFFTGKNGTLTLTNIAFKDKAEKSMAVLPLEFPINGTPENIIVDTTNPVISFTDDVSVGSTNNEKIKIKVTDTNTDTTTYKYGFSPDNNCAANGVYGNSFISEALISINTNNGKYVCAKATDLAGNTTYLSSTNPLNIDVTPPSISSVVQLSSNSNSALAKAGNTVTYTITYNENVTVGNFNPASTGNNATDTVVEVSANSSNTDTLILKVKAGNNGIITPNVHFDITDEAGNITTITSLGTITGGDALNNITADTENPTLSLVKIFSDNSNDIKWAKIGDKIKIQIKSSEDLKTSTVLGTIATENATVTKTCGNVNCDTYDLTLTTSGNETEGNIPFTISFSDEAGNIGTVVTTTTNPQTAVRFDKTAPTASSLVVTSNNTDNKLAKTNNTITVTFTTADNLGDDIKITTGSTILTKAITSNTVSGVGVGKTITRFTDGTEASEIEVPFSFKIKDNAGNESVAFTQTSITGSNVKFDRTEPVVRNIKISATSADNSADISDVPTYYAKQGDSIKLTFEAKDYVEIADTLTGNILGQNPTITKGLSKGVDGNAEWFEWTAEILNINGTEGQVPFDILVKDKAGNNDGIINNPNNEADTEVHITGTTDTSKVIFDKTAPVIPTNVVDLLGVQNLEFKPFEKADYSWTESVDVLGGNSLSGLFKSFFRFENTSTGINESVTLNSGATTFTPANIIPDLNPYKLYVNVEDKAGNKSGESIIYTQKYGIGISGKVTSKNTGENLEGVRVQWASKFGENCQTNQTICSISTDSNGDYSLVIAPNQTYKTTFIKTPNYYIAKTDTKVLVSNITVNAQLAQTEGLDIQGSNQIVTIITTDLFDTAPTGNIMIPLKISVASLSGEISASIDNGDLIITSFSEITSVTSNNPNKIIINEGGNIFRVKEVSGIKKITDKNIQERSTSSVFTSGGSDLAVSRISGNGGNGGYSGKSRIDLFNTPGAPGTFATYEESLEYAKMMNEGSKYKTKSYINSNGYTLFSGYQSGRLALKKFKRFNGADYVVFRGSTQKKSDIFGEKEKIKKIFKQTKEVIILDKNNKEIILRGADERVSTKKVSKTKNLKKSGYGKKVNIFSGLIARQNLEKNKINKFVRQRDLTAVRQSRIKRKSLRGMYLGVGKTKVSSALIFAENNF